MRTVDIYYSFWEIQVLTCSIRISEHYNRCMDKAFAGLSGYRRVADDVVIYDCDREQQHTLHVRQFLQRCAERDLDGYQVDGSITDAISNFPTPATRSELRPFVGLVNQLSASTPAIATLLNPLRLLLSTKNDFLWSSDADRAFAAAKESLTSVDVLSYFDTQKLT